MKAIINILIMAAYYWHLVYRQMSALLAIMPKLTIITIAVQIALAYHFRGYLYFLLFWQTAAWIAFIGSDFVKRALVLHVHALEDWATLKETTHGY